MSDKGLGQKGISWKCSLNRNGDRPHGPVPPNQAQRIRDAAAVGALAQNSGSSPALIR
jgi:hypothetical protein